MSSGPHMLLLAWGFPPCRGSGVYRALALANSFAGAGWQVTVITTERDVWFRYTGADTSLEARIHPGVDVVRVPFAWPVLDPDISAWPLSRVAVPRLWRRSRKLLDQLPFPEVSYGSWLPTLTRAAHDVHRKRHVDLTIATANPHVTFGAAHDLWRRAGVPYVMDYRDAWTLDVFTGETTFPPWSRTSRVESRLISDALEVWFVNDSIRDWYRSRLPTASSRMHTVRNGYDAEFVHAVAPRSDPARPLRFGYLGTITPAVPLSAFVDGWRMGRQQCSDLRSSHAVLRGRIGHYLSADPATQQKLLESAGDNVEYAGPLPKTDVATFYDTLDVLLLILGKGRYVTSGKVYEYMATGLPIVSVQEHGAGAEEVLSGYPRWFPAETLAPGDIAEALRRAARASRSEPVSNSEQAVDYASAYERGRQLEKRIAVLERHLASTQPGRTA